MTEYQLIVFLSLGIVFLLNLMVAAARSAMFHTSLPRLLAHREQRSPETAREIRLLSFPYSQRAGAALLLAQDLLRLSMAGLALLVFSPWNRGSDFGYWMAGILLVSALMIAWSEWVVADHVAGSPEEWLIRLANITWAITLALFPVVAVFLLFKRRTEMIETGVGPVTEDELKSLVDAGEQEGVLEQDEREMIYSIFHLGDTLAREIMIPRIDVTALDVQTPFDQAVDQLLKSGFSRVPVYEESIDNIIGLLYSKDLLRVWREGNQLKSLRDLLRPAYFVPEAKKVDEMLDEMQTRRVHMAVVVDEYGGVAGVVTLEDIVEEIVGEIRDEYDQAEELPFQEIASGDYSFQGRIDLGDFNEIMKSNLPREEAETLGGFIYNHFGRVPTTGESIRVNNLLLTVEQVSGRRIRKVHAQIVPLTVENEKENTHVDE
ncbi:MAG: hemolysin family protein [Omnitrophica WOR_2 bacterium]